MIDDFLDATEADQLFKWCLHDVAWREEQIELFGKPHRVPRLVAWFAPAGVSYRYSGLEHRGVGMPTPLAALAFELGCNHVLLNRYRTGFDYMGWHKDDERDVLGPVEVISLGETRTLRWRRESKGPSQALRLRHGSRLTMDGAIAHTLTRSKKPLGERVSLTFRQLVQSPSR